MSQTNQHRRQLLKVGAGVPVVLTVQSGTAVAASSSMCITKDASPPVANNLASSSEGSDNWLRCAVTQVDLLHRASSTTASYVITDVVGTGSSTAGGTTTPALACPTDDSFYMKVNVGTDTVPGTGDANFPQMIPSTSVSTTDVTKPYALVAGSEVTKAGLVFYDSASKDISGFSWLNPAPKGQQITVSCLNSFA